MDNWKEIEVGELIRFNPHEKIKKGELAKKIPMGNLGVFTKKIRLYVDFSG